jgi:hypothetical protein
MLDKARANLPAKQVATKKGQEPKSVMGRGKPAPGKAVAPGVAGKSKVISCAIICH